MAQYVIPEDPATWHNQVKIWYNGHDPSEMGITGIGQDLDSASKLKFKDWLLLRVLWKTGNKRRQLTHEAIFGSRDGPKRREMAQRALSKEPWMRALENNSDLMEWFHLAPWKMSANDILNRSPASSDLIPGVVYDDADPFRLVVTPLNLHSRPRRAVNPEFAKSRADIAESNRQADLYSDSSRSRDSSAASRPEKSLSPGGSAGGYSSQAGGLQGRAVSGSEGSGTGAESRMINKHRPDEALINMSLTLLLQGVCMSLLHRSLSDSYNWSIVHKQFHVSYPDPDPESKTGRKKILTARTDGCLQATIRGKDADKGDTLAIIEVKPYRRRDPEANEKSVRIQEGAEMAAWISTESIKGLLPSDSGSGTYRRLLISQDFDQVFITIAEFDDQYIRPKPRDSGRLSTQLQLSAFETAAANAPPPADAPRLPFRGRRQTPPGAPAATMTPATPTKSSEGSISPPNAPRPGQTAPRTIVSRGGGGEQGFLKMHEYKAFYINDMADVKELAFLIYSLTEYLCLDHKARNLQLDEKRGRR
ncbi:hypothetical protein F66182_4375 [Fusarium sp. NRRL 66182]|nr:hypothetical protein F66182_4375 [Fusarium sp. NRRL 66182]